MNNMKKLSAGSWMTCITLILAVVAMIVYNVNISGEGYFQNGAVPKAVTYMIVTIVLLAVALILGQIQPEGMGGKILGLVTDAVRIVAPSAAIAALMALLNSRVEGFAFIYFSNEEVLHEVQTAANMASAHGAIANMVVLGVVAVFGMVAAFLGMKRSR